MNKIHRFLFIVATLFIFVSCNAVGPSPKGTYVLLKTTMGDIKLLLYDETPIHRDNFIKLVNSNVYDDVIFHRVIRAFMIQTGDASTKQAGLPVGQDSLANYTIPAEIVNKFYHKKGALAAARKANGVNPEMRSSGTQFYIVQGSVYNDSKLDQYETAINDNIKQAMFTKYMYQVTDSALTLDPPLSSAVIQEIVSDKMFDFLAENGEYKMTDKQRQDYKTIGGSPTLDGTYTIFGEVVEGLDVVDKIAALATDVNDKPKEEVRILDATIVKK